MIHLIRTEEIDPGNKCTRANITINQKKSSFTQPSNLNEFLSSVEHKQTSTYIV